MAETARFQLVTGARVSGRLQPDWPVVTQRATGPAVEPAEPATLADGPWLAWRLLGRNNRDLARSPQVYASLEACLAGIAAARTGAADAETVLTMNVGSGLWTWRRETADTVLAVGSRGYLRQRECHHCVTQFSELAPVALDPSVDAVLVTAFGPQTAEGVGAQGLPVPGQHVPGSGARPVRMPRRFTPPMSAVQQREAADLRGSWRVSTASGSVPAAHELQAPPRSNP